jgi:hypothetical protein
MEKIRIVLTASFAVLISACGERQKTIRELNPVLYIHRVDTAIYAIRINQPQAIYPIHGFPFSWGARAGWKSAWLFVPDSVGRIPGDRVRVSPWGFDPRKGIPAGTTSDWIELGNNSIQFHGNFLGAKGRYTLAPRPFDPCASECQPRQILEPIRPDGTLASQEDSVGPEGRGPSKRLEGVFIDACGRHFDSVTVTGATMWAHDGLRLTAFTRSSPRGHDSVTFSDGLVWLHFTATRDSAGLYRYNSVWSRPTASQEWSQDEWEFVPKAEWKRVFATRDARGGRWLACREVVHKRTF